ncbi:hypothetical protein D3C76_108420 [compost metagenome]
MKDLRTTGLFIDLDIAHAVLVHHVRTVLSIVGNLHCPGLSLVRHVRGPQLVDVVFVAQVLLFTHSRACTRPQAV